MTSRLDSKDLRARTRAFVDGAIPLAEARRIDREDVYPHHLLQAFAQTGLFGINIPEAFGGLGGDSTDTLVVYDELSRRLPVLAWVIGNIMLYGNEIVGAHGSPAQQANYLPRLAGAHAASLATKAEYDDGAYWISGSKMFITGAAVSDVVVTMARTGPDRHGGITAFLVDTTTDGYSAHLLDKLGYHGSGTCEVHYDKVRVAPEAILGGPEGLNHGWAQMLSLLNSERLALSACAIGIGQGVLDEVIAFARERLQGDAVRFQGVRHAIVDMATELEAARQLMGHAVALQRQGVDCLKETSMSKLFASETAKRIALRAVDLMAPFGSTFECDAQRFLRDVLVLSIGGGTSQIQKNIIAGRLEL
jgi:alkylation response protein AidB-like acyl-CoA dehydrogenase